MTEPSTRWRAPDFSRFAIRWPGWLRNGWASFRAAPGKLLWPVAVGVGLITAAYFGLSALFDGGESYGGQDGGWLEDLLRVGSSIVLVAAMAAALTWLLQWLSAQGLAPRLWTALKLALALTPLSVWALADFAAALDGVAEAVPGMTNLMIVLTQPVADLDLFSDRLLAGWATGAEKHVEATVLTIPVVYGGEGGPHLRDVAEGTGLSIAEVVRIHTAPDYTVYAVGSHAGYCYLGGLDRRLYMPRRKVPPHYPERLTVARIFRESGRFATAPHTTSRIMPRVTVCPQDGASSTGESFLISRGRPQKSATTSRNAPRPIRLPSATWPVCPGSCTWSFPFRFFRLATPSPYCSSGSSSTG